MTAPRDHGGGLDAAVARFGGTRDGWVDLSTGINPVPYPIPALSADAWTALPDAAAQARLEAAARRLWRVPEGAQVVAAPGASALIARIPALRVPATVAIPGPTYNEHAAAFAQAGWEVTDAPDAPVLVRVHPNNPDGLMVEEHAPGQRDLTVIDESFCDVMPAVSHTGFCDRPGTIVLKSFGKFWGLAGVRLGFAIGHPDEVGPLADLMGPWAVAGPALEIGAAALADDRWADATRARLAADASRLDMLVLRAGATGVQGTDLFRTFDVADAQVWQDHLARHHIWSRVFPYRATWLRLGLPAPADWDRLEAALATFPGDAG